MNPILQDLNNNSRKTKNIYRVHDDVSSVH